MLGVVKVLSFLGKIAETLFVTWSNKKGLIARRILTILLKLKLSNFFCG